MLQYQTRAGMLPNPCNCGFFGNEGLQRISLYVKSRFCLETHAANSQRCRCKAFPVPPPGFDIVFLQLADKGNFVEMVAKKYFEEQGYNIESYYYLVRNRNKREKMPEFSKICHISGEAKVRLLIAEADEAFRSIGKKIASGDPDLFVYN